MTDLVIGSLGGTIAMLEDGTGSGATPKLTAENLLRSIPGFRPAGPIRTEQLRQVASPSLGLDDMVEVLTWARAQVAAGARAIVLTQGTDTLEETSWLLELFWDHDVPLVMAGAMRTPASAGADGPANLAAAIAVAEDPAARGRGVLVVMNDTIHGARQVTKADALAVQTFVSGGAGPLGRMVEGNPVWFTPPQPRRPLPLPVRQGHEIALLTMALGDGPGLLECVRDRDGCAGLVLAGFGAGHVQGGQAELVGQIAARKPVILCSRTGSGSTATATYGYPGSEIDLAARGVWLGGWLQPLKARILLWAILAAGLQGDEAHTAFAARTGF